MLHAGVGVAAEELAGARASDELVGVDDGFAAGEDGFGRAHGFNAFKHGVIDAHVVGLGADDFFTMRIEDNDIGVRADGNGSFAGIQTEKFGGSSGDKLYEAIG